MPATFATQESPAQTLELTMVDAHEGLEAKLIYTAFENLDVITRAVVFTNKGEKPLYLTRALSACVEFFFSAVTPSASLESSPARCTASPSVR